MKASLSSGEEILLQWLASCLMLLYSMLHMSNGNTSCILLIQRKYHTSRGPLCEELILGFSPYLRSAPSSIYEQSYFLVFRFFERKTLLDQRPKADDPVLQILRLKTVVLALAPPTFENHTENCGFQPKTAVFGSFSPWLLPQLKTTVFGSF